jgi:hypothetical protein
MESVIADITEPIVFWLDGHISPGYTVGIKDIPLIEELEAIAKHPIKNHTLLIDDVRMMGGGMWHGLAKQEILDNIYKINPNYTISYEDNIEALQDILVARVV